MSCSWSSRLVLLIDNNNNNIMCSATSVPISADKNAPKNLELCLIVDKILCYGAVEFQTIWKRGGRVGIRPLQPFRISW
jgi:hypothetical protein